MVARKRLQLSVSGGRTSAFMAKWCKDNLDPAEWEIIYVFANTTFEHPDTLRFVNDVDQHFGLGLVWIEAVVHHGERRSCTHRIVNYQTARRNGEAFEDVVSKYGLPNQVFKVCTRELKLRPMQSYLRSIGWKKGEYLTGIGIRADEPRRVAPSADVQGIVYPLVDWCPVDKQDVLTFWEDYDWDLAIPEHQGNCVTCFKKSERKLNTVWREDPSSFDLFKRLEDRYSDVGPNNVDGPRQIFRGRRTTRKIIQLFEERDADSSGMFNAEESGSCSESCEVYETEVIDDGGICVGPPNPREIVDAFDDREIEEILE